MSGDEEKSEDEDPPDDTSDGKGSSQSDFKGVGVSPTVLGELETASSALKGIGAEPSLLTEIGPAASVLNELETEPSLLTEMGPAASALDAVGTEPFLLTEMGPAASALNDLETEPSLLTEMGAAASALNDLETGPIPLTEVGAAASVLGELNTSPGIIGDLGTTPSSVSGAPSEITQTTDGVERGGGSEIASEIDSFLWEARFQFAYKRTYESLEAYGGQINKGFLAFMASQLLSVASIFVTGQPRVAISLMGTALAIYDRIDSSSNEETGSE